MDSIIAMGITKIFKRVITIFKRGYLQNYHIFTYYGLFYNYKLKNVKNETKKSTIDARAHSDHISENPCRGKGKVFFC